MKKSAFIFMVALAAVSLAVAAKPAGAIQNQYPYAEVCLKNFTNIPIYYSFRWGRSGSWQAREIDPGGARWMAYTYDLGSRVSPNLYVRFDASLGNGGNVRQYVLQRFAVTKRECQLGKGYEFIQTANGIDLKAE